jgi:hypothetical protein
MKIEVQIPNNYFSYDINQPQEFYTEWWNLVDDLTSPFIEAEKQYYLDMVKMAVGKKTLKDVEETLERVKDQAILSTTIAKMVLAEASEAFGNSPEFPFKLTPPFSELVKKMENDLTEFLTENPEYGVQ